MEWDHDGARADDTIDQRGAGGGGGADLGSVLGGVLGGEGGRGRLPLPRGKAGCGGGLGGLALVVLVVVVLPRLLGGGGFDLSSMSGLDLPRVGPNGELVPSGASADAQVSSVEDRDRELADFAKVLITDTNDFWAGRLSEAGASYERTKLVLFTDAVQTGCGAADAGVGPFYCPADSRVYVDLAFFRELSDRFGAAGDFAQAYVVAHEVGHHVQNELGISDQVRRVEQENPEDARGEAGLSVRQELQADCLAGVWAHSVRQEGRLESGDLEEAIRAAAAVGDDAIQRGATGRVDPESFTHGSSASRSAWFRVGYDSGDAARCDTFSVEDPSGGPSG